MDGLEKILEESQHRNRSVLETMQRLIEHIPQNMSVMLENQHSPPDNEIHAESQQD